ncbi:MAG: TlpA disulfide reductase family protein [Thermonemataceae bacterium]|nr:TlpA disulfide reductase family protein [Thermonemataceae bacterium]
MKKVTFFNLFILFLTLFACQKTKEESTITGFVKNKNLTGKVYLAVSGQHNRQFFDQLKIIDSTEIKDGKFDFKVSNKEVDIYAIAFANAKGFNIFFTAGEGAVNIKDIDTEGKEKPYILEGSNAKDNELNHKFLAYLAKFNEGLKGDKELENWKNLIITKTKKLDSLQEKNSPQLADEIKIVDSLKALYTQKADIFVKSFNQEVYQTITEAMPSVGSILLAEQLDTEKDYVFLKDFADKVAQQMPNSTPAKNFVEFMSRVKNAELDKNRPNASKNNTSGKVGLAIGDTAPDFSSKTPEGKEVKLSSLRGKVVLVDFWAAWCRPCRMENPNVVRAYQKYKAKGFDILGVSLDREKEAWLAAIKKDNLTWTQISDLQFWDSPVVPLYEIEGIPANFLLDKEGKIIAKNLRGAALEETLAKILK